VEKALQAAYLKERGKISLPGFRKGRVPRQMIEKMYGPEVFYDEAANRMISEAYAKAYDECELELVSQPKIEITQLEKGKEFIFTAEVAVKPEVKLGEYKGLKVDKVSTRVTQKEVDEEIDKERERNARTIDVTDRAVQDKDQITLDFEGFVDGVAFEGGKASDYPLTIGSGAFIPGFEDQLIGANIDEEKEINVTFPEEYQAKELAGKAAVFKCTVHSIKAKELPELDDEFVSDVSEKSETVDAYKAEVKAKIKERKENEGKQKREDQSVEQAVANAEMDIPEAMISFQSRQMVDDFARRIMQQGMTMEQYFQFTGLSEEKMMEEFKPEAEKRIRTRLTLEAIVAAENIEVSEERLDEELQKMADSYKMEVDKLKEYMGENEKKQMKEDIAIQEAVTLIANAAVEG
jgi:trigger factor